MDWDFIYKLLIYRLWCYLNDREHPSDYSKPKKNPKINNLLDSGIFFIQRSIIFSYHFRIHIN
jgi:hypothetical protein